MSSRSCPKGLRDSKQRDGRWSLASGHDLRVPRIFNACGAERALAPCTKDCRLAGRSCLRSVWRVSLTVTCPAGRDRPRVGYRLSTGCLSGLVGVRVSLSVANEKGRREVRVPRKRLVLISVALDRIHFLLEFFCISVAFPARCCPAAGPEFLNAIFVVSEDLDIKRQDEYS